MAEIAAVVLVPEIYGFLQQINGMFNDGKDLIENVLHNPERARSLARLFARLLKDLARVTDLCKANAFQLPEEDLEFFADRINKLKDNLQETCEKLEEKIEQLRNPISRVARAQGTGEWLSELETSARHADELLRDIKPFFMTATLMSQQTDQITTAITTATRRQTRTLRTAIAAGREAGDQRDCFCPCFDVPENPPHVVLNYQSSSDQDDIAPHRTLEAKLKLAVLRSDGSQSIAAVGSSIAYGVGIEGMSGVGKSCALRGLATDPEVRERFQNGGIFYILFGKDATKAGIVEQIAEVLEVSGGSGLAEKVREKENIDAAVSKARQWFAGKCVLLLIDDVWEENAVGRDTIAILSRIVDITKGSRVVFTTRDMSMALGTEAINFSSRNAQVSLQMLLKSAGLNEPDIESFRGTVEQVLGFCAGLPMALAVAGIALKMRRDISSGLTTGEVWDKYLSDLRKHRSRLLHDTVRNVAYDNLASTFMASLSMLSISMAQWPNFQFSMPLSTMYRALIVLQRQGWVPVTVLERLWETGDDTERVMRRLVEANLALLEYRVVNGEKIAGISLHDLHLDFAQDECKKHGDGEQWHRKLLNSYVPEVRSSSGETYMPTQSCWKKLLSCCVAEEESGEHRTSVVVCRNWCCEVVFKDEYIRNNLCRHLLSAKLETELHSLLRNPRWVAQRLCEHEILPLENDFSLMLDVLKPEDGTALQVGSDEWSLKMVAGAARLSAPWVSRNRQGVWFQLYARLRRRSEESEVVRKYLVDVERCAERPWVKALTACLPEPGGALQSTVLCDGYVEWISPVDASGKMFVCGRGSNSDNIRSAFVSTIFKGDVEETVWLENADTYVRAVCCTNDGSRAATPHWDGTVRLWNALTGEAVGHPFRGHTDWVLCVAFSADGTRVASGSEDNTVRIWDAATGEPVGDALRGHVGAVLCVAWSPDGSRLALGSRDGTVRMWDVATGAPVGDALRDHNDTVSCLAWSADGTRLVSGSYDHTVRMWDAESGEPLGDAMRGHGRPVCCVAWAADGKRLASGAVDSTVRLWDAHTGAAIGDALQGHSGTVRCVLWSPDGRRVISGSNDNTVRVWDGQTCSKGDVTRGHGGSVSCVSWSPDGRQVASGSDDRTIRIWDARTCAAIGDAMHGHDGSVECVAWSPDGRQVASGSDDRTIRIWDARTCAAIGDAMHGHDGSVECVAWSPNGRKLASGSADRTVRIWDSRTGAAIGGAMHGHDDWIRCVAWSPDGRRVASGSFDKTARVWDSVTGECLRTEDDWGGDRRKLVALLDGEGAGSEGVDEERRVTFDGGCVRYTSSDDVSVLATLEQNPIPWIPWEYSPVSRRIVSGYENCAVDFFELVE